MNVSLDRLESLFTAALQKPPADRSAYLDQACGGDPGLRQRVEALLRAQGAAGSFLEPAAPGQGVTVDESPIAERPGTVIGPYKLLEPIGEGGFGVVFQAEQTQPVRRKVALKVLKPGMDSRQVVARFEAERQALALMDHPNIAHVFDGGATASGRPYFVMELVKGIPLTDFCDQNRLPVRERLELFLSVCQAVQHAHQKGIIHRDLKPSNVLVSRHDTTPVVKVIDFGVAKALGQELTDKTLFTGVAQMIGTPLYMSPEQAGMSDLDADTRSDIYSLGVLLYELLTGTTPFTKERFKKAGYDEIRRIIREEEPPRPSTRLTEARDTLPAISAQRQTEPAKLSKLVRGELDWIVMKALEKDRSHRYETANALALDVQRFLADEPVLACPPSAWYRFRKLARRNKAALATASVVALVVSVAVALSTVLIWRANRELQQTLQREQLEAYFHRITLAHHALSADNLGRALTILDECPEDLRGWEWHYLTRLCRVEPLVLKDKAQVNGIAFSPDGQHLASACGDGTVKVWDSRSGRVVQTLPAHRGLGCSVVFHPDGRHLASVGTDKLVKVWEWATGRAVFQRPCDAVHPFGTAYAAAFSPLDPDRLAVGHDGGVTLWDWRSEKLLHTFPGHEKYQISVAFSRDGRRLASADWRGGVRLWDPVTGGELLYFPESRDAGQPACALAFSRGGERLAAASFARRVDVWDTSTGRLLHTIPHSGRGVVLCVAYSPDGRYLVSSGEDKTVHVWDAETGREVLDLRGHSNACGCVAFSPDGQRLASASADGSIRIWDGTPLQGHERQETATFTGHSDEVWSVAFSPVGQRVVSGGWGMPVTVWDATTRRVSARFSGHSSICFCVAWQPDGKRIASASSDSGLFTVKVWDAQTGREVFPLPGALPGGPEVYAVAFSPDGQHLVTGTAKGAVQVWDARTGDPVRTLGTHKAAVRGVVFSPDRRHLASVSGDGEVKLWDAKRVGTALAAELEPRRTPLSAHVPGACLNVAFSPDGKRIALGGQESTVKICAVDTGEVLHTLRGHHGDVYTVAFGPDDNGRWVASAGEDSTVRVWDSNTGKLLRTFRGHTGLVTSLAFIDGRTLISGSRDHTIKFWDLTPLEVATER